MKRRQGAILKEMGKHGKAVIAAAGRQSCAVNGPEWGESDETESEDHMEFNQKINRQVDKRGSATVKVGSKKFKKMMSNSDERNGNMEGDDAEFKVILRFSEEKGVHDMSPVKLTTILKNQIGDVKMAKVLRDGNLLMMCINEEQRERVCRMKEIGRHKVISVSRVEKRYMRNRGVIWGIPVDVNMEEIKANLKGGKLKNVSRLHNFKNGIRQVKVCCWNLKMKYFQIK